MSLSTEERAAVLAAILAAGPRAADLLGRLAGESGARCAAEAKRFLALDREARAAAAAGEARLLLGELPGGFARVHGTWIEAALAGESEAVRRAIGGGGEVDPAVRLWLRRRLFGALVGMPEDEPPRTLTEAAALPCYEPAALLMAFERVGRRRLAVALSAAGPGAIAALAARLGPVEGRLFSAEAQKPAGRTEVSAAVKELADLVAGDPAVLVFRAGVRHTSPAFLAGDLPRQLAQRLPRDRGLVVLDECARARPDPSRLGPLAEALQ